MKRKYVLPFTLLLGYVLPVIGCGPKSYTITFDPNNGEDTFSIVVKGGTLLEEPEEPTKTGYDFNSWRLNNIKWSFKFEKVTSDMTLVAFYKVISYDITYDLSEFDAYLPNTNESTYPKEYTIESQNVIGQACSNGYNFSHWEDQDGNVISKLGGIYGDLTLKAKFTMAENFITLGEYPNHVVKDEELSNALDQIPNKENGDVIEYNGKRYEKCIFEENPLFFVTRVPEIIPGKAYYFEYEPILWRIVSSGENAMTLLSEYILFHAKNGFGPNTNYADSYIRQELKNEFYNTAFTDTDKSKICLAGIKVFENVNYRIEQYEDVHYFSDIADKVFIPSYEELTGTLCGFSTPEKLLGYATEYAICQDAYYDSNPVKEAGYNYEGMYYLRDTTRLEYSATKSTNYSRVVSVSGEVYNDSLNRASIGVRPMIMIEK